MGGKDKGNILKEVGKGRSGFIVKGFLVKFRILGGYGCILIGDYEWDIMGFVN